ncbi:DUF5990 family protein [Streptomyces scopuliridis]|uniref:DUF5990 family protein n=1 Tax=Streptomyces scopuliridis TaxID=452529 RepID=UPI003673D90D
MARLTLRITGRELPGRACGCFRDVHVAPQRGGGPDPDQLVRGDAAEASFEIPVDTTTAPDGSPDFRGPHVQGRRGARFVYLTWGELPPGEDIAAFRMFRRAKLFLADLPPELRAGGDAGTTLSLTDAKGLPRCAGIRPPELVWRAGGSPAPGTREG